MKSEYQKTYDLIISDDLLSFLEVIIEGRLKWRSAICGYISAHDLCGSKKYENMSD